MPRKRLIVATLIFGFLCGLSGLTGCVSHSETPEPTIPVLDESAITRHMPPSIKDREGWAEDITAALRLIEREPTAERVCAVVAVIQQESGFQKDPVVANLPDIVRKGLEKKFEKLGILKTPAIYALLSGQAPGSKLTFAQRVDALKSERDLDRLFRDIAETYREKMPGTFAVASAMSVLLGKGALQDLNPVTTAGSMQVKVSFAKSVKGNSDLSDTAIREQLYTRAGGIRYGTARLIAYPAQYDDILYRFADYNAGLYTSRNAAFQAQLSDLTGEPLTFDGDLLAYGDDGEAKDFETESLRTLLSFGATHDISSWTIHHDAKKEKSEEFEETTTRKALRAAWEKKNGRKAPYAQIPNVKLNSPKLSKTRTTSWFATSVKQHYQECRARD